jgi:pterin-4a-carbinolamine dehydratase
MKRYYNLQYWNNAHSKIEQELPFKNYCEAWGYLLEQNFKILSVKYIGWK